jgi:hypothetical protein
MTFFPTYKLDKKGVMGLFPHLTTAICRRMPDRNLLCCLVCYSCKMYILARFLLVFAGVPRQCYLSFVGTVDDGSDEFIAGLGVVKVDKKTDITEIRALNIIRCVGENNKCMLPCGIIRRADAETKRKPKIALFGVSNLWK